MLPARSHHDEPHRAPPDKYHSMPYNLTCLTQSCLINPLRIESLHAVQPYLPVLSASVQSLARLTQHFATSPHIQFHMPELNEPNISRSNLTGSPHPPDHSQSRLASQPSQPNRAPPGHDTRHLTTPHNLASQTVPLRTTPYVISIHLTPNQPYEIQPNQTYPDRTLPDFHACLELPHLSANCQSQPRRDHTQPHNLQTHETCLT